MDEGAVGQKIQIAFERHKGARRYAHIGKQSLVADELSLKARFSNSRASLRALVTRSTPYSCLRPRSSVYVRTFGKPRAQQLELNQRIERIGLRDHDMAIDGE